MRSRSGKRRPGVQDLPHAQPENCGSLAARPTDGSSEHSLCLYPLGPAAFPEELAAKWADSVPFDLLIILAIVVDPQEARSWVELHFSNNGNGSSVPASVSIYNGDMEKILLDAQHESGRSSSKSSHCDSPPRSQTPQDTNRASETDTHSIGEKNSSQSEEDDIERRKEVESILKKNSDWIWDWSSRPENIPPKEFLFKHPKRTATLSMRNTSVMKKGGIFSAEFLKVFLPSLLLSHLLAIGLGIYIGRRLTTSTSTF
ncbi:PREDICTED: BCL2/adenovirus E1B 19 kDa protein-interacting protein 3 [Mandrillus leucophaeus]|uniref:BCL2/adenovirus E1B 19 kDa protein-interacting protein 3 n=1 Tax=Mandrillus leucophaeus TaxID=9568 RepID=UPI0005F55686|nr:PREDICTED: BCL2/adenovirus E1B 19 kDa protein-interacting protein 3 [Mandrillus leucophaeus]